MIDGYNSQQSRLDSQFQDSDLVKDTAFLASVTEKQPLLLLLLFFPSLSLSLPLVIFH